MQTLAVMYYEIEDELGNVSTILVKDREQPESIEAIAAGDYAPLFYLRTDEGFPVTSLSGFSAAGESRSLIDLLRSKPLVLTFYCACWGSYAPKHFEMLQEIAPQIEAIGGQLLVLTNETPKQIERLTKKLDVDLNMFHDKDHNVARSYGVYSETSPIWDRIAGISDEVFTPSLFVIGRDRKVAYTFVDENFDGTPDRKELLKSIFEGRNK
jgi:peroxiredoxin